MIKKQDAASHDRRHADEPWKEGVDSDLHFLRKGHIELTKVNKENHELIVENTKLTKQIGDRVSNIDTTLEELKPVMLTTRAVRKGGKFAYAAAIFGSKVGRVGLFLAGLGALIAIFHGERWSEAWQAFIKYVLR